MERLDKPEKHWKFSFGDLEEREHWDDYQDAFEQTLQHTSTKWAPWWVVPADHKWVTRALVAGIVARSIDGLGVILPGGVRQGPGAARRGRDASCRGALIVSPTLTGECRHRSGHRHRQRWRLLTCCAYRFTDGLACCAPDRRPQQSWRGAGVARRPHRGPAGGESRQPGRLRAEWRGAPDREAGTRISPGTERLLSVLRQRLQRRRVHARRRLPAFTGDRTHWNVEGLYSSKATS